MRKNFNLLVLATIVALVGLTATMAAGAGICGDSNADGTVDISDAVYLIAYIFSGGQAPYCPPVIDIDGNGYDTVTIGTQVWMAENLKVTHYRNGDAITKVTDFTTWAGLSTGAYCEYDNDVNNVAVYGRLYNWYSVTDSRNIAPVGWHVASDAEWQTLVDYLGGYAAAGGRMKEVGTTHWLSPNTGATNESGFSALHGGYRSGYDYDNSMFRDAFFWSSTESGSNAAQSRGLSYSHSAVGRYSSYKVDGFSVRCVKD